MNKAHRHELKKRGLLTCQNLTTPKSVDENGVTYNYTAFRSHSVPCSCSVCSHKKYNRAKIKVFVEDFYDKYGDMMSRLSKC